MPTREQALHAYQEHSDYQQAGQELGVPPGQAYLNPTATPAEPLEPDDTDIAAVPPGPGQARAGPERIRREREDQARKGLRP